MTPPAAAESLAPAPAASTGRRLALQTVDLRKDYHLAGETISILKGINLTVEEGDYVAIMGPSGSGKTTLLNLLGCLDKPTSGEYHIAGHDVAKMDDDGLSAIRSQHIGFVFQAYNLIQQMTVLENVESPLAYQGGATLEDQEHCRNLAERVGLGERTGHRPTELSGGQQQRAAIARSLASRPRFILADEPTGNLDSTTAKEILRLFDSLNEEGATIVMVTHEESVAHRARRIVRLLDGEIEKVENLRPPAAAVHAPRPARPHGSGLKSLFSPRDIAIGIKSLLVHPLRSLLTMLGIFIGVASVIWLLAIGEGISMRAQQQIEELGANNLILTTVRPRSEDNRSGRQMAYGLTEEDCRNLAAMIPTVEMAIQFTRRQAQELRYRDLMVPVEINGCRADYQALYSLNVSRGRFLNERDNVDKSRVCVLAQEVADAIFRHEDPLGRSVRLNQDYYRVVGLIAPRSMLDGVKGTARGQDFADNIYIPLETFWTQYADPQMQGNNGGRGVSQITLRLRDKHDAVATSAAVLEALKLTHQVEDYSLGVPMELLEQARNTRLMFMGMMGLIAGISLVVGGIGIMNIMLATVTERTREIGIRRALGARRKDITRQFIIETVLLSVAGGLTGILGGLTCGVLISLLRGLVSVTFPQVLASLPPAVQGVDPIILPWSIPLAFGISVAVGIVFGLYPARRAASMNPIDALRYVS